MDAKAYCLQARSAFHFGLRGVGIEASAAYAPSDTLFSALCHALRQWFGLKTLEDFLAGFQSLERREPPVLLSSAFPYVLVRGERQGKWRVRDPFVAEQAVRFFPRPLTWPRNVPDLPDARKEVKRIEWVSEGVFRAWIEGQDLSGHWDERNNLVQGGRAWLTTGERQAIAGWRDEDSDAIRIWAVDDVPRVTVDRQRSTSAVYQAGVVRFQPGGGLWLAARWREDWRERGEAALQVLSDSGIGGERSSGYGLFHLHGPLPLHNLPTPAPGERFLTLSLYFPTQVELPTVLKDKGVCYRLRVRRGWISSPDEAQDAQLRPVRGSALRRRAVRMFAEGSLLYWPTDRSVAGALADVTPVAFDPERGSTGHKVWRYGFAFPVAYRGGGR